MILWLNSNSVLSCWLMSDSLSPPGALLSSHLKQRGQRLDSTTPPIRPLSGERSSTPQSASGHSLPGSLCPLQALSSVQSVQLLSHVRLFATP